MLRLWMVLLMLMAWSPRAEALRPKVLTTKDGTRLEYQLLTPAAYDPKTPSTLVVALPPGAQDAAMVDAILQPWKMDLLGEGWVLVSPAAPPGRPLYGSGDALVIEMLDALAAEHSFDRIYLLGVSNGGRASIRLATSHPERFHSVVVIPGAPTEDDLPRLTAMKHMAVTMVVGSQDGGWVEASRGVTQALTEAGGDAEFVLIEGGGHMVFQRLPAQQVIGWLNRGAPAAPSSSPAPQPGSPRG